MAGDEWRRAMATSLPPAAASCQKAHADDDALLVGDDAMRGFSLQPLFIRQLNCLLR